MSDTKGVGCLPFESGGFFHIPLQCDKVTSVTDHKVVTDVANHKVVTDVTDVTDTPNDLCASCEKKRERTDAKVETMTGTSLQGTHPSYLHGLVTDPIPIWSHIYDGTWYRLKISSGSIVSDSNMAKAKAAAAATSVPPEPVPLGAVKKTRAPASVKAKTTEKSDKPPDATIKQFKLKSKSKTSNEITPIATLTGESIEPETIIRIDVKKVEIDGRQVYLDSSTDKVYDLKCKYIGRHDTSKGCISPFPDSDVE